MSNCYTQFSAIIPCQNEEQRQWLLARLTYASSGLPDAEEMLSSLLEADILLDPYDLSGVIAQPSNWMPGYDVWVYSEESGSLEGVASIVSLLQTTFNIQEPWGAEASFSEDKPKLDSFSGSAVFVHKGEIEWFNTYCWLQDKLKGAK